MFPPLTQVQHRSRILGLSGGRRGGYECGAIVKYELARYPDYFHPTVKNFTQAVINNALPSYYGDPLRDFSLENILNRFAVKNPEKPKTEEGEQVPKR